MFCSRCGTSLAERTTFCTKCGAPIGNLAPPAAVNAPVGAPPAAYPQAGAMMPSPGAVPMVMVPAVPYAGFWLRFVAYLLDVIIVGIVAVPIVVVLAVATGASAALSSMSNDNPQQALATAGFVIFLCSLFIILLGGLWLYYALLESSSWQGTVGKKALGLIVTDLDGRRVSFGRATARFFSRLITGLVPLFIGYILAGITAKKQALHDMIAGTLVLRKT
jgi:uncharacterized RDD family membrane protein YckC